jgi:hypothetical protein
MPLEDLLIDKKEELENLIGKAKELIGIDKESGNTVIKVSKSRLLDRHLIGLYLIGKFFASELKKVDDSTMTPKELENVTGLVHGTITPRLTELKKEGFIRSPTRGKWEIVLPRVGVFLDEVIEKIGV